VDDMKPVEMRPVEMKPLDTNMDEFEIKLREQMRRVDAPPRLQSRVMVRIREQERARASHIRMWSIAIAATLLLAVFAGAGLVLKQRHERQQAELARQQFEVAMRVTARSMSNVQRAIERAERKAEVGQ
jgi:hypothetical protein